jgi:hypothetical protein
MDGKVPESYGFDSLRVWDCKMKLSAPIAFMLSLIAMFLLVGCAEGKSGSQSGFAVEKKYSLTECVVRLGFIWADDSDYVQKTSVLRAVSEQMNKAIVSGEFPLFSGHTTRDSKYLVIYFADECENRGRLLDELVSGYFMPNIEDFPPYEIQDEGIEPGFDGVMPNGWWIGTE